MTLQKEFRTRIDNGVATLQSLKDDGNSALIDLKIEALLEARNSIDLDRRGPETASRRLNELQRSSSGGRSEGFTLAARYLDISVLFSLKDLTKKERKSLFTIESAGLFLEEASGIREAHRFPIAAQYEAAVKRMHPDAGGNDEDFCRLKDAMRTSIGDQFLLDYLDDPLQKQLEMFEQWRERDAQLYAEK